MGAGKLTRRVHCLAGQQTHGEQPVREDINCKREQRSWKIMDPSSLALLRLPLKTPHVTSSSRGLDKARLTRQRLGAQAAAAMPSAGLWWTPIRFLGEWQMNVVVRVSADGLLSILQVSPACPVLALLRSSSSAIQR